MSRLTPFKWCSSKAQDVACDHCCAFLRYIADSGTRYFDTTVKRKCANTNLERCL
jgi:hypothetical protein